jgi:hypothetical protein
MRKFYQIIIPLVLLLLAGCVDGKFSLVAPDNLDITPSATPTSAPTATPSPTPLPSDFVDPNQGNQQALTTILAAIPAQLPAGTVQWRRDFTRGTDGIEPVARAINGVGAKVYYTEQSGFQMNLTFAVFDTPEDAAAHYEFIRGIRQPLETGSQNDDLPTPNIFGSGLYGSVAIFQIENVFIEVNIESFSSTQGNPLVPLARETIRFFDSIKAQLGVEAAPQEAQAESTTETVEATSEATEIVAEVTEADTESTEVRAENTAEATEVAAESATGHALLDAFLDAMPNQIMGDAIWTRDMTRFDGLQSPPPNFDDGDVIRVFYREQTGGAMQWTIGIFDTPEAALVQYERFKGIREGLGEENAEADFPQPHIFGQGLYGSVALFQIENVFIEVLIERAPGTVANPLESISRAVLNTLETAQASIGE